MAHDLTETATFDTPVTVPDPGDPAQAGVVAALTQALANRSQFLKQYTDQVATGVIRLRVGNNSQMQNLTATDYECCLSNEGGLFYYFNDAGAETADGVFIIDSLTEVGAHWFHSTYWLTNYIYGGYCCVGPNFWTPSVPIGKIPQEFQTNYLVAQGRLNTSGTINDFFEDGNSREVEDSRFIIPVVDGDKILINLGPLSVTNQATSIQMIELRYSTNGGSSWGVIDRFKIPPSVAGHSFKSYLNATATLDITSFTGDMVFCLWGIVDAIDSLVISTSSDYTYGIGHYTQYRA